MPQQGHAASSVRRKAGSSAWCWGVQSVAPVCGPQRACVSVAVMPRLLSVRKACSMSLSSIVATLNSTKWCTAGLGIVDREREAEWAGWYHAGRYGVGHTE